MRGISDYMYGMDWGFYLRDVDGENAILSHRMADIDTPFGNGAVGQQVDLTSASSRSSSKRRIPAYHSVIGRRFY